jgi:hypothetical protein
MSKLPAIADLLGTALQEVEKAREAAESAWGEEDARTKALLQLWCDIDIQRQVFAPTNSAARRLGKFA